MNQISLNKDDIIRLMRGVDVEPLQIEKNTCVVVKVDRDFLPILERELLQSVQAVIYNATGINPGIFIAYKDVKIETMTLDELKELRMKTDLMITHIAMKKNIKEKAN